VTSDEQRWSSAFPNAQHHALRALGIDPGDVGTDRGPTFLRSWQAVVLDHGGDDGYWMRLLRDPELIENRVGALVIVPGAIAYSEVAPRFKVPLDANSYKTPGRALAGFALTAARIKLQGAQAHGFWTWKANASEVASVEFDPAVDSLHGAFAVLEVAARGETARFGVIWSRPLTPACLAAARELADACHSANGPSSRPPRTDGLYVCAAHTKKSRFWAIHFDDRGGAVIIHVNDVARAYATIRDGSWQVTRRPYGEERNQYSVGYDEPVRIRVLDDRRLVFQFASWDQVQGRPTACGETRFVTGEELMAGWGTVRCPVSTPRWTPELTSNGDLRAPDIGYPVEVGSQLEAEARRLLVEALAEAANGRDPRRTGYQEAGVYHYTAHRETYDLNLESYRQRLRQKGEDSLRRAGTDARPRFTVDIVEATIDGQSCVCCEAHDSQQQKSVAIVQPVRKTLGRWKTEGSIRTIRPAEPLPGRSRPVPGGSTEPVAAAAREPARSAPELSCGQEGCAAYGRPARGAFCGSCGTRTVAT
jgi:hypothetical protein